jgi:uncharacterized protein YciI
MSYFTVTRKAGAGWQDGGIQAQSAMSEHGAFMKALADEGVVLLAGPVAGTEGGRLRALLVIDADNEEEIRGRLANDPWTLSQHLEITSIEPWNLVVGAERLTHGSRRHGEGDRA